MRLGILPSLNDWSLPGKRIHALDPMGHNWWSVWVSSPGVAASVLLEDVPEAADAERATNSKTPGER